MPQMFKKNASLKQGGGHFSHMVTVEQFEVLQGIKESRKNSHGELLDKGLQATTSQPGN